jgi:CHASE3 domain sensor protein
VVYRSIERAQDSNQRVVLTQEVLSAIEVVLSTVVDADSAGRSHLTSPDARSLEPFERGQRTIDAGLSRLAALTVDKASQQTRVEQLRRDTARMTAALRAQAEAARGARPDGAAETDAARASMDAARATMRAMRTEENRLLADRVQSGRVAVRRLQALAMALTAVAVGLTAWIIWLLARHARRQQQGTDVLRRAKEDLESQVDASAADLRDSNARLRSIIDSAVDGIIVIDTTGRIEAFNRGAERLLAIRRAKSPAATSAC